MTRNTGPTPATVELVWERDAGRCARCGKPLRRDDRGQSWSLHHRMARGAGGSRSLWVNLPGNLVLLDGSGVTGCHGDIESDRGLSYDTGWLVRRNGNTLPTDIPYIHHLHGFGHALDNGLFERITP